MTDERRHFTIRKGKQDIIGSATAVSIIGQVTASLTLHHACDES